MKRISLHVVLSLVLCHAAAVAQVTEVVLDSVTGIQDDTLLVAGEQHTFYISLTNLGSGTGYNPSNGFRIFSPDTARWSYPVRDTFFDTVMTFPVLIVDTIVDSVVTNEFLRKYCFDNLYINYYSMDGQEADTVSWVGVSMGVAPGLYDGWESPTYEIPVRSRLADHGKHICIDSSWFRPGGTWKWAPLDATLPQIYPDWSGQRCFAVFNPSAPSNLVLSEDTLFFDAVKGGPDPPPQDFDIASDGNPLYFTLTEEATWLIKSPAAGTTPATVTVSINAVGLAEGSYFDSIEVASDDAANSPQFLYVVFELVPPPPEIAVSSDAFFFNAVAGGDNPLPQILTITNAGGSTLNWTVSKSQSWLQLSPSSGVDSGDVTVAVDITGLAYDTYRDTIVVGAPNATNSPVRIPVTLNVGSDLPIIEIDVPQLYVVDLDELDVFTRTFDVLNAGAGTMNFWVEENSTKILGADPSSGTAPETVTLTLRYRDMSDGDQRIDTAWVYSNEAINSPQPVPIRLRFAANPAVINIVPDTIVLNLWECYQFPAHVLDTFTVHNVGMDHPMAVTLEYESEFLTVDHDNGIAPEAFVASGLDLDLPLGSYYDTIVVSAIKAINSPQFLIVNYNVIPRDQPPEIATTKLPPLICYQKDTGPMLAPGFTIRDGYGGCMLWTIEEDIPWLTPIDSAGDVPDYVQFLVEPLGLGTGCYTDSLFVVAPEASNSPYRVDVDLCIFLLRGDVDHDNVIDIADVTGIIRYLYIQGPRPEPCFLVGDVDCDGLVDVGDLTYLIKYLYMGGPIPCKNPY